MIWFMDIDGVVADCTHRLKYINDVNSKKDYRKFYSQFAIAKDDPIPNGIALFWHLKDAAHADNTKVPIGLIQRVVFLTSRNERCRTATVKWLMANVSPSVWFRNYLKGNLIMRPKHDHRPASELKVEQVREYLSSISDDYADNYVFGFIDDDPENVSAMKAAFPNCIGLVFGTERL